MSNKSSTIHEVLAKSYLVYFFASVTGLFIDSFISVPFNIPYAEFIAMFLFAAGPMLLAWAQFTSRHYENKTHAHKNYFERGPYTFIRNPTHLGLLLLVTGYTLISGSLIFFATTLIGYLVSNIFFTKYESILSQKHGEDYHAYKSKVTKI